MGKRKKANDKIRGKITENLKSNLSIIKLTINVLQLNSENVRKD